MDFPLWDSTDDQDDVGQHGEYPDYRPPPDIIEDDAINTKCCMQVLRILIHKADEEIVKLEEDILMLQRQLAWDDDEWRSCSAALREKIDHLDALIKGLETETSEDVHIRRDDSIPVEVPTPHVDGASQKKVESRISNTNKEVEENEGIGCVEMLKKAETESSPLDIGWREILQQLSGDALEIQRVCAKPIAENSGKIQNSRAEVDAADKLDCSKFLLDYSIKCTVREKELEVKTQLPQVHETEVYITNKAEPNSSLKSLDQETRQEFRSRNVQKSFMESPSVLSMKRQHNCEVLDEMSKNVEKRAHQEPSATEINGASETTSMSISSQRRLSLNSQTIEDRGVPSFLINLGKTDCDATNSTPDKAINLSGEDAPKDSSPYIKSVEKLTIKDLRTIARNNKMQGYSRLSKDELRKRLGL